MTTCSETPSHLAETRDGLGVPLIAAKGLGNASALKFARWRGRLDRAEKTPDETFVVINHMISGGVIHRLDRKAAPMANGALAVRPGDAVGVWSNDAETEYDHFYLRADAVAALAAEIYDGDVVDELTPEREGFYDTRLLRLLESCAAALIASPDPSQAELDAWSIAIATPILARRYRGRRRTPDFIDPLAPDRLTRAVDAIEARLHENLTLAELAASCGMSPFDFLRRFKAATGLTPHQYVIERRIERARRLLRDPDSSLADIAFAVGFSSQSHLTTTFKRHVGVTPARFRRAL